MNLDFHHAYDRVCLPYCTGTRFWTLWPWVIFRRVIKTLQRDISASFLLQRISMAFPMNFLVRQGDLLPC
jgi:hypothetical protein